MRVPMNMDTKLDVLMLTQGGTPWTVDVAGQLSVTTRSDGQTSTYTMAATDVVNGKARVVIPGQTDPNGARLRLVGTVNGEPTLLAMGTLLPIDFAGVFEQPPDVIDDVPLMLVRGQDANIDI